MGARGKIPFILSIDVNYRIQHPPMRLPQRIRVRRHRHNRPLQQFRARIGCTPPCCGHESRPAASLWTPPAGSPCPTRCGCAARTGRPRGTRTRRRMPPSSDLLDAQRPADWQPARRRPSRSVMRPHHHRIAPVVIKLQSRKINLRRSPRPLIRRDDHAATPRVHRLAPHDVHDQRPNITSHAIPSILSIHAKTPEIAGPSSATKSGASSPSA